MPCSRPSPATNGPSPSRRTAYDRDEAGLAQTPVQWFDRRRDQARPVTLADVDARGLTARLRDRLARLLTPFL